MACWIVAGTPQMGSIVQGASCWFWSPVYTPVGLHLPLNLPSPVYMAAVVEQLKQEGYPVQDSDLAHVWPTRYAHIRVYGKYYFNVEEVHARKGLRPLRTPGRQG